MTVEILVYYPEHTYHFGVVVRGYNSNDPYDLRKSEEREDIFEDKFKDYARMGGLYTKNQYLRYLRNFSRLVETNGDRSIVTILDTMPLNFLEDHISKDIFDYIQSLENAYDLVVSGGHQDGVYYILVKYYYARTASCFLREEYVKNECNASELCDRLRQWCQDNGHHIFFNPFINAIPEKIRNVANIISFIDEHSI